MSFTYPPESRPLDGYTIKRAISVGGFGEVYYGLSDAGKEVALKLLRHNFDIELRGVTQCLNLNHPNLLQIFDIRTDRQGQHWIVMEYLSGSTLDELMRDHPSGLSIEEADRWLKGIASGLSYLHEQGLVHRDLKPANIFREGQTVKVGDVGLSKFISESQRNAQTQSVGTVYYMAPEVAHGKYGREVDVYALGVMLYEMLTGDVPFTGESTAEILMKHLTEKPKLENLPARIRPVVAKALEKDPALRTPSVERLAAEFDAAITGRADSAPMDIPAENILPQRAIDRNRVFEHTVSYPGNPEEMRTIYPDSAPGSTRVGEPRAPQREEYRHARRAPTRHSGRYAYAGEAPAGLGIWKWVLIAFVIALMMMSFGPGRHGRPSILMLGLMVTGGVVAVRTLIGWLSGAGQGLHYAASPAYQSRQKAAPPPTLVPDRQQQHLQRMRHRDQRIRERREKIARQRAIKAQHIAARRRARVKQRQQRGLVNVDPSLPREISFADRLADGTTSMTVAALVAAVITLGVGFIDGFLQDFGRTVLFGSVTTVAAWSAIALGKWGEGRQESFAHRRLMWATLGGVVGYVAWWLSQSLLISFNSHHDGGPFRGMLNEMFDTSTFIDTGVVNPVIFMVFFALLFGLRRWNWQTDALRPKRVRVGSVLMTVVVGWVAAMATGFPTHWAVTLSAAISGVVQVASVWMPMESRQQLVEGTRHVA